MQGDLGIQDMRDMCKITIVNMMETIRQIYAQHKIRRLDTGDQVGVQETRKIYTKETRDT